MSDLVRVTDTMTGHRYTTAQSVVDEHPSRYRVLKSPAVDANGRPLPPEFPKATSDDSEAGATEAANPTEATEEAH